jgi:hypothetical protein
MLELLLQEIRHRLSFVRRRQQPCQGLSLRQSLMPDLVGNVFLKNLLDLPVSPREG